MSGVSDLRRHAAGWWSARAERERLALGAAAAIVLAWLLWALALAPAWRTLKSAPAELEALEAQAQQMQALAAEAGQLRAAPPIGAEQARAALAAAAARLGEQAVLTLQGERAVLNARNLGGDQLGAWLTEARLSARARAVDGQLTRNPQGGYDGNLVVAFGAKP